MEITAKPRHRGWLRLLRAVLVVGALWGVALLIPPALGLQTHVVDDAAMAGTHARGSLVFDEQISPMQLAVGDVVSFVPPDADPAEGTVTRRVVAIGDTHFSTRGDAASEVDPWLVPLADDELERVAFALPWVGYPLILLGALTIPPWLPAAAAIGLAALLVLLRRGSRGPGEREPVVADATVRAPAAATVTPPLA